MRHRASRRFWESYRRLPDDTRRLADRCYVLLREDPQHGSLALKKVGHFWSVRIGMHYRALAAGGEGVLVWFWIGSHADYDRIVSRG